MSLTPEIFEKTIKVTEEDIDEHGHVNNVRFVQLMEDISKAHWEERASENIQYKFFWVVVRHEIDYKKQAYLGDELLLQTFIGDNTHVTSIRHVIIRNRETDEILIKAKTTWCLMDRNSRRPVKISDEMFRDFNV